MATTPKTVMTYPLNGSNRSFPVTFDYLARKFVQVTLLGQDRRTLVMTQDYRFSTDREITTNIAWGPAQGYETIEIRRLTSATERLVDFSDGSILRAYDLNIASVQALHIAEEARDLAADTIAVNNDGHLDARGRKIVNVANATNGRDAVNLQQVQEWSGSALNQANRAKTEADRAQTEANRAKTEADRSQAHQQTATSEANRSKTEADRSRDNRVTAENQAAEAARQAGLATTNGQTQVAAAAAQANSATSEANRAAQEATNATNNGAAQVTLARQEVTKATEQANIATNRAQAAAGEANRAATEANRSRDEANRAKAEADKLGNVNALGGAIEYVNGTTVKWKGETDAKVAQAGWLYAYGTAPDGAAGGSPIHGGKSPTFAFLNAERTAWRWSIWAGPGGKMNFQDAQSGQIALTLQPDGAITRGRHTVEGTQRSISNTIAGGQLRVVNDGNNENDPWQARLTCDTLSLQGGSGNQHLWFRTAENAENALIYFERSSANLVFRVREQERLRLKLDGSVSTQGNVHVGGALVQTDGNVFGAVWGNNYLSTYIDNTYKRKVHTQAGRMHIGNVSGWQTRWVGFHQAMADPVITVIFDCQNSTVPSDGGRWCYIMGYNQSGFNCRNASDSSGNWANAQLHWMAQNVHNSD